MESYEINPYGDHFREQMLSVWESSVRATHHFLTPSDFEEIKETVESINFSEFQVFCLTSANKVLGFVGVADKKVEMLFLDPEYFGRGLGKILLNYAVNELKANKVDVNAQNIKALQFYQKSGFEINERTEKDDQGRDYPLFRMKLIESILHSNHENIRK